MRYSERKNVSVAADSRRAGKGEQEKGPASLFSSRVSLERQGERKRERRKEEGRNGVRPRCRQAHRRRPSWLLSWPRRVATLAKAGVSVKMKTWTAVGRRATRRVEHEALESCHHACLTKLFYLRDSSPEPMCEVRPDSPDSLANPPGVGVEEGERRATVRRLRKTRDQ